MLSHVFQQQMFRRIFFSPRHKQQQQPVLRQQLTAHRGRVQVGGWEVELMVKSMACRKRP